MPTETSTRQYTTRRQNIVNALVDALESIDGTGAYHTALHTVEPRLKFWDEVTEFPAVHVNAGRETRTYDGGGFKFRYLSLTLRCYVEDNDDSVENITLPNKYVPILQPTTYELARFSVAKNSSYSTLYASKEIS